MTIDEMLEMLTEAKTRLGGDFQVDGVHEDDLWTSLNSDDDQPE